MTHQVARLVHHLWKVEHRHKSVPAICQSVNIQNILKIFFNTFILMDDDYDDDDDDDDYDFLNCCFTFFVIFSWLEFWPVCSVL